MTSDGGPNPGIAAAAETAPSPGRACWSGLVREGTRLVQIAVPKLAGGAFLVALNFVLLRLIDPERYGQFALCMTAVLLADAIIGGPFDLAVIRLSGKAGNAHGAQIRFGECAALRLKLALVILAAVGLALVAEAAGRFASAGATEPGLLFATAFVAAAMLLLRSTLVHLQIEGGFCAYAAIESLHVAVKAAALAFYLLLGEPSVPGILLLFGTGPLLAGLWGARRYARHLLSAARLPLSAYREVLTVSPWYVATIALGATIGRLDILLLGGLGRVEEAGLFSAGQIVASLPELLGSYVAVLVTPHLVPALRAGGLGALYRRVQPLLILVAVAILGTAFVGQGAIRDGLYREAYAPSATIAFILLPAAVAGMVTIPLALPVVMFERKRFLFTLDCVLFPLAVSAYLVAIPAHGGTGAAVVTAAVSLLRSAAVQAAAFRLIGSRQPARNSPPVGPAFR